MTIRMPEYERETKEFQPVYVTVDGVEVTTGISLAVVEKGKRPVTYGSASVLGSNIGVWVENLETGVYEIFARVTAQPPEIPAIPLGKFRVT